MHRYVGHCSASGRKTRPHHPFHKVCMLIPCLETARQLLVHPTEVKPLAFILDSGMKGGSGTAYQLEDHKCKLLPPAAAPANGCRLRHLAILSNPSNGSKVSGAERGVVVCQQRWTLPGCHARPKQAGGAVLPGIQKESCFTGARIISVLDQLQQHTRPLGVVLHKTRGQGDAVKEQYGGCGHRCTLEWPSGPNLTLGARKKIKTSYTYHQLPRCKSLGCLGTAVLDLSVAGAKLHSVVAGWSVLGHKYAPALPNLSTSRSWQQGAPCLETRTMHNSTQTRITACTNNGPGGHSCICVMVLLKSFPPHPNKQRQCLCPRSVSVGI